MGTTQQILVNKKYVKLNEPLEHTNWKDNSFKFLPIKNDLISSTFAGLLGLKKFF